MSDCHAGQVSRDAWPFSLVEVINLDVGEPGFIRRRRKPEHAGSNPAIQTPERAVQPSRTNTLAVPAWSGRHPLKVEIVGSNPIQGTDSQVVEWADTPGSGPGAPGHEGSTPSLATRRRVPTDGQGAKAEWRNGRRGGLKSRCPRGMRVRVPPRLVAGPFQQSGTVARSSLLVAARNDGHRDRRRVQSGVV